MKLESAAVSLGVGLLGIAVAGPAWSGPPVSSAPQIAQQAPQVVITKVESAAPYVYVTIENHNAFEVEVDLKHSQIDGTQELNISHHHKIPAHGTAVEKQIADLGPKCVKDTKVSMTLEGTGNVDKRVRHATRKVVIFKNENVSLGNFGAPPAAADKQINFVEITPAATYACGKPFKAKVKIKNNTAVQASNLKLEMHDARMGAAGLGPKVAEATVTLAPGASGEYTVESNQPTNGLVTSGEVSWHLVDPSGAANNHLGYYSHANMPFTDISHAAWDLQ